MLKIFHGVLNIECETWERRLFVMFEKTASLNSICFQMNVVFFAIVWNDLTEFCLHLKSTFSCCCYWRVSNLLHFFVGKNVYLQWNLMLTIYRPHYLHASIRNLNIKAIQWWKSSIISIFIKTIFMLKFQRNSQ